jgi:hypothetical protein
METSYYTVVWQQFGAAIDMLDHALITCPAALWEEPLWRVPPDQTLPPELAEFWYIAYHTLFWLDLYLTAAREEEFTPPAPFTRTELDPAGVVPTRVYTKEELRSYLTALRQKCRTRLLTLTDEQARQTSEYPWIRGQTISYLELQIYTMRHVQEHAAQLSLFLGQRAVPDVPDWVARAEKG